jgi:CheY-like chemotaxis protein
MSEPDVLLIDASKPSRYALRLQLLSLGARVRQAQSIEEALPQLAQRPADLIVTATALPGMNALELLELMAARDGETPTPVLIHCPDGRWPLAATALRHGALAVMGTDELQRRLPELLRDAADVAVTARGGALLRAAQGDVAAPVPNPAPAQVPSVPPLPSAPSAPPAAMPTALPAPLGGASSCWIVAAVAAVAGLLVGLWIA